MEPPLSSDKCVAGDQESLTSVKHFSSSVSLSLSLCLCVSPIMLTLKRKEEKRNYSGSFQVEVIDIG